MHDQNCHLALFVLYLVLNDSHTEEVELKLCNFEAPLLRENEKKIHPCCYWYTLQIS